MALINCPECGREVSDEAKQCPICGYPIGKRIRKKNKDDDGNKHEEIVDALNEMNTNKRIKLVSVIVASFCFLGIVLLLVVPKIMKAKPELAADIQKENSNVSEVESENLYFSSRYEKACAAEDDKQYQLAYDIFSELAKEKYKDSSKRAKQVYNHIYREEKEIVYLEMGCGHGDEFLFATERSLSSAVKAKITIAYKNDVADFTSVTIEYYDPVYQGVSGWSLEHIKLIGNFPKIMEGSV